MLAIPWFCRRRAGRRPAALQIPILVLLAAAGALARLTAASQPPAEPWDHVAPNAELRPATAGLPDAAALFRRSCERCHDADGRGTNARRRNLQSIPDFSRPTWQARRRDEQLLTSILDGKGSSMPAFGGRLDPEQVRQLVAYVRRFGPRSKEPGAGAADDFERRFHALEEKMKELRRQYHELVRSNDPL
jgi:mono/diheme cytochrome c family protein